MQHKEGEAGSPTHFSTDGFQQGLVCWWHASDEKGVQTLGKLTATEELVFMNHLGYVHISQPILCSSVLESTSEGAVERNRGDLETRYG